MDYIDISSDNHVHTALCKHATGTMEEYILAALRKGLSRIVFLEHMEEGVNYFENTWLSENEFDQYFDEGTRLKNIYSSQIDIALGVEVGYNKKHRDILKKRLQQRDFDAIGISYHYSHHPSFPYALNLVSRKTENIINIDKAGRDELLDEYFDQLIEAVKFLPGTMLCHIDAGLRHQKALKLSKKHFDKIKTLLLEIKKNNMSLEVNTSGFGHRGDPYPGPTIIRWAHELNIQLVASSDAHKPDDIGRCFGDLPQYIKNCLS